MALKLDPGSKTTGMALVRIEQTQEGEVHHALHLAEVMQMAMHNGDEENAPETSIVDLRLLGQKKSMSRAAVVAGIVLVALVVILRASFAR